MTRRYRIVLTLAAVVLAMAACSGEQDGDGGATADVVDDGLGITFPDRKSVV